MSLKQEDIVRAALALIDEFGDEAELEAARRIDSSRKANLILVARIWEEISEAITKVRANERPVNDTC